ncbi:MAG TPA: DPP IV N-terminal domain-containing protein, partial [Bryobacteraceae bacterium]|nr:DPP IV N-terminal domain-containing protein [Bryobacteraceae bacterium]
MRARTGWLAVVLMLFAASVGAQRRFALTVDNIMSGPGLVGYEPSSPRWSGDSSRVYFEWKQPSDPVLSPMDTYVVARDGSAPRKLSEEESKLAPPVTGDRSEDKSKTVFVRDGDVFVYDHASDKARRLTKTADVESGAQFTRDGERVWFTRSSNLYAMSLKDGVLEQLTDIRPAGAAGSSGAQAAGARAATGSVAATRSGGEEQKGTDSQEALKKEERDLLDIVKQRAARREEEEARKKRENPRKPLTLQARQSVTNLSLSPDGKTAIVSIAEPGQGAKTTIVPNFVTETGYTEDIPARTKVGDVEGRVRVALISVADGSVKYVDHGQRIGRSQQRTEGTEAEKAAEAKTSAAGIGTAPARTENTEARGSAKSEAVESQDRAVDLLRPEWSNDGTKAVMLARSADNKDRWVLALDPATGKTRVLASVHDESWVGGPGALTLGWLKGDRAVYFQSERDGYSHLYTVPFDGGEPKQLTSGKWEVLGVRLSEDKSRFYLTTNEGDPAQVHLYSMAAEGGPRTKITAMPGSHRGVFSPDEKWIADVYSFSNKPPELHVMENRPGAQELKLTNSPTED